MSNQDLNNLTKIHTVQKCKYEEEGIRKNFFETTDMERERQNSLESIHDSDEPSSSASSPASSQTGSIIASSSDDDNEEDEDEENLVKLLKQQTWTMTSSSEINRIQSSLQRSAASSARMKSPPRWSQHLHQPYQQNQRRPRRSRTAMRNDASSSSSFLRENEARGKLQPGLCSIPEDGLSNLNHGLVKSSINRPVREFMDW